MASEPLSAREALRLEWPGKAEALRAAEAPPQGQLVTRPDSPLGTGPELHTFIAGENLAVLKLLAASQAGPFATQAGSVKLIYIDPPYNRGNPLVYDDRRGHEAWLSFMLPRLVLARRLLSLDGALAVSIDDNEVHRLRLLLDEVFGAERFVAQIVVQSNKRGQTYLPVATAHEYLLIYSRSDALRVNELPRSAEAATHVDPRGAYELWELRNRNPRFGRHNRPNLHYPLYVAPGQEIADGQVRVSLEPSSEFTVEVLPRNSRGEEGCWRWSREAVGRATLDGPAPDLVARRRRDGGWNVYQRARKQSTKAKSIWLDIDCISERGTVELAELGLAGMFDHPKPLGLVQRALQMLSGPGDLVLDFFAGSCTLAQAVLELNQHDVGRRRFIVVQEPAPLAETSPARAAGLKTLADVGLERIRQVLGGVGAKGLGEAVRVMDWVPGLEGVGKR